MDLLRSELPAIEKQNSVLPVNLQKDDSRLPRIERCEFETLLERAMEILSVRENSPSSSQA